LQGSGKVPDEHIRRIIAEDEVRRAKEEREHSARRARELADEQFERQWNIVYPDRGHLTDRTLAERIAANYLSLANAIRERHWDFLIAGQLSQQMSVTVVVAIRLLAHACVGNREEILDSLAISDRFATSLIVAHSEWFDSFRVQTLEGLPFTPPLTLDELACLTEVTRDKLRGDIKAGRWASQDTARYLRHKRWRSADSTTQESLLRAIRENFSEKMWSKLNQ
jgi:hypothetical protein